MKKIQNVALDKLRNGDLAVGIGLRQARTVDIAPAMKTVGFDWLFIDMEHNSMDLDMVVQICVTARAAGISPIVRVPGFQHFHASRALDGGAQGIVFPHVDDAETAMQLVEYCRYPPVGTRSVYGTLPQLDFEALPLDQATLAINNSTLLVFMLESPNAIANANAIAAVPGVEITLLDTGYLFAETEWYADDLAHRFDLIVANQCIAIKSHFCVKRHKVTASCFNKWINLDE